MRQSPGIRRRVISLASLCMLTFAGAARADEIWIAPTYQTDMGGLGVGNGVWPVSPLGVARLAIAVPDNLETFQFARIAIIPSAPAGPAVLHVYVCSAQNGTLVAASCAGPSNHAFTGVVNQLVEVDISADLAARVSGPGAQYLAVLAYTTPTTATDHVVGMRFGYTAPAIAGPEGPMGPQGPEGPMGPQGIQGPAGPMPTGAALVGAANVFTATQTISNANLELGQSTATSGNVLRAGTRFLHSPGADNVFLGLNAGSLTSPGYSNTAIGSAAMTGLTTGNRNTALGHWALPLITEGSSNTAIGYLSMRKTTEGHSNTALGALALFENTLGANNVAVGSFALVDNVSGHSNVAIGESASPNVTSSWNTVVGTRALYSTTTGSHNVALGLFAGADATTGSHNIFLGADVRGAAMDTNTIRLGTQGTHARTVVAGIRGVTTGINDAIPVVIDSNGQLGTISSSRRFKEDIQNMSSSLGARLLRLRPVTFRYTQAFTDGSKPVQYGLVAEEVAEVFPELAVRDGSGQIETVHYETLNVLLLKQVQEQQRQLRRLEAQVRELMSRNKRK